MDFAKGKQISRMVKKEEVADSESADDEVLCGGGGEGETEISKKMKLVSGGKRASGGGNGGMKCCQAEDCSVDLSDAKTYHRRHKVCEYHAKARAVLVSGIRQRFCQQCSRFHELSEFDEAKRSCRRRLAGHNERRRKNAAESQAERLSLKGTVTQLKDMVCGQVDDRGRIKITIQEHATYKHFQIR